MYNSYSGTLRKKAVNLRKKGHSYSSINKHLNTKVPKSTLSTWCSGLKLSQEAQQKIRLSAIQHLDRARESALATKQKQRNEYFKEIQERIEPLGNIISRKDVEKIVLATLYLGEGTKSTSGSLIFCNSDPGIVETFLRLLRSCYQVDERRFRGTVQCRADQNINQLEKFWSSLTKIPPEQFYGARIDPRSIGKATKKSTYKGVCRVDYFSAEIYHELMMIARMICEESRAKIKGH